MRALSEARFAGRSGSNLLNALPAAGEMKRRGSIPIVLDSFFHHKNDTP